MEKIIAGVLFEEEENGASTPVVTTSEEGETIVIGSRKFVKRAEDDALVPVVKVLGGGTPSVPAVPEDEKPDFTTGWRTDFDAWKTITHGLNKPLNELDVVFHCKMADGSIGLSPVVETTLDNRTVAVGIDNNTINYFCHSIFWNASNLNATITQYRVDIYKRKKHVEIIEKQVVIPGSTGVQTGTITGVTFSNINWGTWNDIGTFSFPTPFTSIPKVVLSHDGYSAGGVSVIAHSVTKTGFAIGVTNVLSAVLDTVNINIHWIAVAPDAHITDIAPKRDIRNLFTPLNGFTYRELYKQELYDGRNVRATIGLIEPGVLAANTNYECLQCAPEIAPLNDCFLPVFASLGSNNYARGMALLQASTGRVRITFQQEVTTPGNIYFSLDYMIK